MSPRGDSAWHFGSRAWQGAGGVWEDWYDITSLWNLAFLEWAFPTGCSQPRRDYRLREHTMFILDEGLTQSRWCVGQSLRYWGLPFPLCSTVITTLGPLNIPDANSQRGELSPRLRCRCRKSESWVNLPRLTQRWGAEPLQSPGTLSAPLRVLACYSPLPLHWPFLMAGLLFSVFPGPDLSSG